MKKAFSWLSSFPNADECIHVYSIPLNQPSHISRDLAPVLSLDEEKRKQRLHFKRHQMNYAITRTALRLILSHYLNTNAKEIVFSYSRFGKPGLKSINSPVRFNVSHSGTIAVVALNFHFDIGIDIEQVRALPDMFRIAKRFFSQNEYHMLEQQPKRQQKHVFFNIWSQKEAFLKATGKGIFQPLSQIDTTIFRKKNRTIYEIALFEKYSCAIAIKGPQKAIIHKPFYF